MDGKMLEMTKATVKKVDTILRMESDEYRKEYGCETDRVDKAKIEKVQTLVESLGFFLDVFEVGENG